ncbi:lysylphosphatidylglycerol synthase domain-containing protein [Demequina silvatica]|uniref:lysylphosphatidylglycerol synthase domain-containing protein n=1 Tax=Demequina silvatica TaxID=1638988 RepID=UPI000A6F7E24|nr:lysylphosphatidylglycerol synthase domain-containing protein [Demequina silvatica]
MSTPAIAATDRRDLRRRLLKGLVIAAVSISVGWLGIRLVGRIQWSAVGDALAHLAWWQGAALAVMLGARQLLNATPVARFVPGLTLGRAVQNDLSANLAGTLTPPPGDVVIRVAMFRSWGINPVDGMAGVTLNSIVFYGARFIAPVLGLALFATSGAENGQWLSAGLSGALAVVIIGALVLIMRSEGWAVTLATHAARLVGKMRASVDREAWITAATTFRAQVAQTLRTHLFPALAGMLCAVVVDGVILTASIRFVGIDAGTLGTADIIGAFLMAYPLTILPLFGLGVMDAILIAGWTAIAGLEHEATLLAGTVVWRTVTLGGTLVLGAAAAAWWRRTTGTATPAGSTEASP